MPTIIANHQYPSQDAVRRTVTLFSWSLNPRPLTDPKFLEGGTLKTFDFIAANPPFDKRWSTGLDPLHDPHERIQPFGTRPAKQGDYAYLLHLVRSLKSTSEGATPACQRRISSISQPKCITRFNESPITLLVASG